MSFQFIVISISEEKKKVLLEQMREMELEKYGRVHFINAATLDNTQTFFEGTNFSDVEKRNICCSRSHLFAVEFACLESSPEFSIILEDDIAFHKTQFLNAVRECVQRWNELMDKNRVLSLGWVPICTERNWYECIKENPLKCLHGSSVRRIHISGLQAYMIRKQDFKPYIGMLITKTFIQYARNILEFSKQTNKSDKVNPMATDATLNLLFGQSIVYPPLCVERPVGSMLGHHNWRLYWAPFFKDNKMQLCDYHTFTEEVIDSIYPSG